MQYKKQKGWQEKEIKEWLLKVIPFINPHLPNKLVPSQFCAVGCEYVEEGEGEDVVEHKDKVSRVVVVDFYGNVKCDLYIETGNEKNANQTTKKETGKHSKISKNELTQRLKKAITKICICFDDIPETLVEVIGLSPNKYQYGPVILGDLIMNRVEHLLGNDLIINTKVILLNHHLNLSREIIEFMSDSITRTLLLKLCFNDDPLGEHL